jgi:hypothetical protein
MRTPLAALAPLLFAVTAPALAQAPTASTWSGVESLRAEQAELSIHEVRGGRRSSSGRSRSYSRRSWSSDDWAQTYRGPTRSGRRDSTYDPAPPVPNETQGAAEPPPARSSEMSEPTALPDIPVLAPIPVPQPAEPVPKKQTSNSQWTAEPEVQRLEPPRVCRRLVGLSHAALATCSI